MHIPFYHDIGHGLYWGAETLRWVSLRRSGGTALPVGTWEASIDNDPEAALAHLVDTVAPDPAVVATHVEPAHVMIQVQALDVHADVERWTEEQVDRMLPPGVPRDAFRVRTLPLGTGAPPHVLVAVVRRDAVAARVEMLQAAGLTPTVVGDLRVGLGFAYAFDPEFTAADADLLLSHDGRGFRLRFEHGQLAAAPTTWPAVSEGGLGDLLAMRDDDQPLFLAGSDIQAHRDQIHREDGVLGRRPGVQRLRMHGLAEEGRDRIRTQASYSEATYMDDDLEERGEGRGREERESAKKSEAWTKVFGFDSDGSTPRSTPASDVSAPFVPAAALAMQQLYVAAAPLNFLGEAAVDAGRDRRDRRDALRLGLTVGGVVGGLLLVSTLAQLALGFWTQSVQDDLTRMQAQMQIVETAERRRDALRERLRQSRRLAQLRTHAAVLLERVGRSVPEEVWLDGAAISYGEEEENASLHRVGAQRSFANGGPYERRPGNASMSGSEDASSRADAAPAVSSRAFVRVTGFAPKDRPIAGFLGALERQEALSRVRLVTAHQLGGEDLRRFDGSVDAAHRFDIRLEYHP